MSEVGWESVPCICVLFCEVVCCVFRLLCERVFVGVWDEEVIVTGVSCGVVMDVGRKCVIMVVLGSIGLSSRMNKWVHFSTHGGCRDWGC